jgi:hypothetical protein
MKIPSTLRSASLPVLLASLLLAGGAAVAQTKMTPEQEKAYRDMIAASGANPDDVMGAARQVDDSRKWTGGPIDYHAVGVYSGKPQITSDPGKGSGVADVTDQVILDFKWDLAASGLVGTPKIQNSKSALKNPRDLEPKCLPPVLKGEYEHADVLSVKNGLGGALELDIRTTYPVVEVVQFCTGARKAIPGAAKTRRAELVVPSPMTFGMKLPASSKVTISPDRKSLICKDADWTWTFTPKPRSV